MWNEVIYEPGTVKVIAYKNGEKWAENEIKTTGEAVAIDLQSDRQSIAADGTDLVYITATIQDKEGLMVPRSNPTLHFTVEGPGEIVATDNGDATSFESFQSPTRKAFNGLALAIVKATKGATGVIKINAESHGLKTGSIEISITDKP